MTAANPRRFGLPHEVDTKATPGDPGREAGRAASPRSPADVRRASRGAAAEGASSASWPGSAVVATFVATAVRRFAATAVSSFVATRRADSRERSQRSTVAR